MRRRITISILLLLLVLAVAGSLVGAGSGFTLNWWTVDGGGGTSQGGAYTLNSTSGQADATYLAAGDMVLQGGFWGGAVTQTNLPEQVLLPLVWDH